MKNKGFWHIFISGEGFYLWIILILNSIIAILNWRIAIPAYFLLAILTYHHFRTINYKKKEVIKYIENLTFNMDMATKDTMLNFPMPLVVLELDGTIIWYNSSFKKIFEGEKLLENTISSFVKGFNPEDLTGENLNISREMVINEVHYKVLGNFVTLEGNDIAENPIILLYFIENTEITQLKAKYEDEKIGAGIIIIDNYNELMQNMEDSAKPHVLAEIDKKITHWTNLTLGIIKKYERDRYLFIFEHKYLKIMEEKKFDILDSVKEISLGNKIPVTLSIGIGINGESLVQNIRDSESSIDIALGRGGDQAVIKNNDNFSFHGGKTRELEKRTKVKARVIAYALRELIDQSPNVLIMGHENGDSDSLGASLGVYRIAKSRGKDTNIVLHKSNSAIDSTISKFSKSRDYDKLFVNRGEALNLISKKTLLIVVDTYKPGFTEFPELLEKTDQIIVIDHHRKGTDFIQDAVLVYQETYASSTCELVTEIMQYVDDKIKLKPLEAEALYAGIVVDTKNFTFKTGVRTFEAASYLKKQGVDTVAVKQLFQNDLQTYLNISNVVRDAEIIKSDIAISHCRPGIKDGQLIAAKSADELLNLAGISAAFVLCQINNEIFISGRSLGDVNVQLIMEKLGGGGHFTVAGAQLQGISIEEAKKRLKYVIIEYMKENKKEN